MSSERENLNYGDFIGRLYGRDGIRSRVREITFQLTSSCNLNCSYCYEHHKK